MIHFILCVKLLSILYKSIKRHLVCYKVTIPINTYLIKNLNNIICNYMYVGNFENIENV